MNVTITPAALGLSLIHILRQLEAGDRVQLFGDYKGAQFVATLVLKL